MNKYANQPESEVLVLDRRLLKDDYKLCTGLTLGEFGSKDNEPITLVHPALLVVYYTVRAETGYRFRITSGYRSPAHNKAEGGSARSYHTRGMAIDIVPVLPKGSKQTQPEALLNVEKIAKELCGGIEVYETKGFIHLDVGPVRNWHG